MKMRAKGVIHNTYLHNDKHVYFKPMTMFHFTQQIEVFLVFAYFFFSFVAVLFERK